MFEQMEFINASKESSFYLEKKKAYKANYIIAFLGNDEIFNKAQKVIKYIFIPNKKLLKKIVKEYNIKKDLLILGYEEKRYALYKLEWCI